MGEERDSRPRGRPKDPRKRALILDVARALFLEQGLAAVSMDAIADRAGVSKATVYSHFLDKEELFRAVLEAEAGDYDPPAEPVAMEDLAELRDHLTGMGIGLVSVLTRPGVVDLGRLLVNEARRHPDLIADFYSRGPAQAHQRLSRLLALATSGGLLDCPSPERAADQLLSMWIGQRHHRQQLGLCPPPDEREVVEHVTACVDVILKAYRV